jgi:hypothetical protein
VADLAANPFAILTFIAAPAIMTNASSVLALGTSNRFARNVDRSRVLIALLEGRHPESDPQAAMYLAQLPRFEQRAQLLLRAMSSFYFAVGAFAAASLTSLLGALVATSGHPLLRAVAPLALVVGTAGLCGLIQGCTLLVRETRLALRMMHEEATFYRSRYAAAPREKADLMPSAPPRQQ